MPRPPPPSPSKHAAPCLPVHRLGNNAQSPSSSGRKCTVRAHRSGSQQVNKRALVTSTHSYAKVARPRAHIRHTTYHTYVGMTRKRFVHSQVGSVGRSTGRQTFPRSSSFPALSCINKTAPTTARLRSSMAKYKTSNMGATSAVTPHPSWTYPAASVCLHEPADAAVPRAAKMSCASARR